MSGESMEQRTVEVLDLPEGLEEELLYLYFENKRRSGGGPLESVEKKDNRAVLVFEEAEAAARVLAKGHHVLLNTELGVKRPPSKDRRRLLLRGTNPDTSAEMIELYVENMMDLNMTDYALIPSPGRDVVVIHLSQPLSKDFQTLSTKISKRTLDGAKVTLEQVEQTDSVLVENLHPGTTPDLLTLYFESERGGSQKVKEVTMLSEGTAKVSFGDYESVDSVLDRPHKLNDTKLVVKPCFDFLQPAQSSASDVLSDETQAEMEDSSEDLNDIQMRTSPLLVDADPDQSSPAGTSDSCQSSSQTTLQILADSKEREAKAVVEDLIEKAETLSCHVAITDPVKCALFRSSTFYQDVQKANPNFSVQNRADGVHIEGPNKLQLQQLKDRISDFIGSMVETRFILELEKAQFLDRKDVKEHLLRTIHQPGSSFLYTVSDSTVSVTSLSQKSADQACSFLKSQVGCFSMPVEMAQEAMLCCREWSEFLQSLGFTSAKVSEQGGNIDVLTLKGMEDEKQAAIMEFLTTPIERETVISMEPGRLKYIQIHCHQLLADMDQVSIFPLEAKDACGLKIHGDAVACQMAEEVLEGVVSSICTRTIKANAPGVARFLDEKECRSVLNEMETKFQVYICPVYVPWKPLQQEDIFETALQMMSQKNFQKGSVNDSAQDAKSDSVQTDCNGTSNRGLLDGAEREPNQLDDMDDVDLYTAEQPDEGTVEFSQSPADQNAASGSFLWTDEIQGLDSDLEEEAQLSLAIQYSLESSNRVQKDDEEQLKKALELSKQLIEDEHTSGNTDKTPSLDQQKTNIGISLEDLIKAANTIELVVFAGYSCDLIRVDIAFGKKVSQRQVEEKLEHRNIRHMSDYHRKCLETIKRKHAVEIQIQGTIVAISGFKDYVTGALCDVKLLIEKISNSVSDEEILKTVQWVRHDPASSDAHPYSADASVFIENAWRMKLKKVDILLNNQPHIISFDKMQEYNIASGKSVKISRKLIDLGNVTQDVPEEEYSLLANLPEATKVDEESDEFQDVVKNFYGTIQEYHSKIRIIQVEKLMNRLLYNQYKLKKASVLQQSTHPTIERTLYHGTSEASVKEICVHGFNRSFCGKNATVYGQGVYFAVNSALSVQDQYSPPNTDGYKFVFVSKVLTGDFTKGCHSMKTAPLKETGDIPLRYDSVTDDISRPTMFVIFNDTQAFPEYLITCQRIHR
ncbi:protein mono-ADP-ribosyltransferase PARP10 [Kryptolebias marmoratus]|uniref:Poly [ADP-ribose] polymerase n=1 Tax=Kryptolebias marmoratus TaxID=37003 RepID=A0A3Q2ZWS2_KRYMA|nr:protein mono-ADP-ribosyltransferase PARP10 [Kryptolebias marmoratus]